jgi:hypothetical protein
MHIALGVAPEPGTTLQGEFSGKDLFESLRRDAARWWRSWTDSSKSRWFCVARPWRSDGSTLTIVTGGERLSAPAIENHTIRVMVVTLPEKALAWLRELDVGARDSPTGGDGFRWLVRCV